MGFWAAAARETMRRSQIVKTMKSTALGSKARTNYTHIHTYIHYCVLMNMCSHTLTTGEGRDNLERAARILHNLVSRILSIRFDIAEECRVKYCRCDDKNCFSYDRKIFLKTYEI